MMSKPSFAPSRRGFLKTAAGITAGLAMPTIISGRAVAASGGTRTVNLQLGWMPDGKVLGEIVASKLGYFEEVGLNLALQAGGPSIDGVAMVASGRYEIGQVSSSPSIMLAASQGIPIMSFATCLQKHPFAFFSLPAKPINTPADMRGKKVGIQGTARPLMSSLLRVNNIDESEVEVIIIGSDSSPLATGQVDCVSGWLTSASSKKVLGPDVVKMPLWDNGVRLYANPYYATRDTITQSPDMLANFLRAAGRGWAWVFDNRDKAIEMLVAEYPNFKPADERASTELLLDYVFTDTTASGGWGWFDPAVWQSQISTFDSIKQFSAGAPALENVATTAILELTATDRPKIG